MILLWRITDNLLELSVDEFDKDYNGIYGFLKLQADDYSIGYIVDDKISLEGNSDILYYITGMVECGISIYKNETYEIILLNYNLLKLYISFDDGVKVDIINNEEDFLVYSFKLSLEEFSNEIENNYNKLYSYIMMNNPDLIDAKIIRRLIRLYNIYQKVKNI